jgi:O-antigen ligase
VTALLVAWWIVITPFAVHPHTALHGMHGRYNGLLTQLTMVALFLAVASSLESERHVERFITFFAVALVPVALYALAQDLGFDPLIWPNPRPGSTIGHPVPLAAIIGLAVPFVLAFLVSDAALGRRWLWSLVLALFLLADAATLSRGPWAGLAVALAIVLAFAVRTHAIDLKNKSVQLVAIVLVTAVALLIESAPITRLSQRVKQLARLETDPSFTNRFVMFNGARAMLRDHPIVGIGFESFGLLYPGYRPIEPESLEADSIPSMVHNGYLQTAVTSGWPGLALYLALIGSVLSLLVRQCARIARSARAAAPPERPALLRHALVAVAFIAAIVGYLVEDLSGWLEISLSAYFWMIAGAAVAFCTTQSGRGPERVARRWRTPLFAASVIVSAVFATLAFDTLRELRADRGFFQSQFLDVGRDWPAIQERIVAGLRLVGDDAYYQDAAGVLYLKRFHNSGEQGAYERAASLFDRAAQTNRFDPYILIHRLDLETAAVQRKAVAAPSDLAARAAVTLLSVDRNNATAYEAVANFRNAQGRLGDALESIRRAETLRPNHTRYHALEGDILRRLGDRSNAAAAYRREAASLKPADADWLVVEHKLLVTLIEASRLAEALDEGARVVASAPRDSLAHTLLGIAYRQSDQLELATRSFLNALAIDPSSASAQEGRRDAEAALAAHSIPR